MLLLCRYTIMLQCWELDPDTRPSFSQLINSLSEYLETIWILLVCNALLTFNCTTVYFIHDYYHVHSLIVLINNVTLIVANHCMHCKNRGEISHSMVSTFLLVINCFFRDGFACDSLQKANQLATVFTQLGPSYRVQCMCSGVGRGGATAPQLFIKEGEQIACARFDHPKIHSYFLAY